LAIDEMRRSIAAHRACSADRDCVVSVQNPPYRECCFSANTRWWEGAERKTLEDEVVRHCGLPMSVCRCPVPACVRGQCTVEQPFRFPRPPGGDCRNY
jgi:hypothetical protein